MKKCLLSIAIISFAINLAAQNCAAPSSGFTPINDLEAGTFNGWMGGLYPGGSNDMPAAHRQAGKSLASEVKNLDTSGKPDVNGKIVWLSIGMSNTTQETQQFISLANVYPGKNPQLKLVDGAQGGQTAAIISTPGSAGYANFWNTVNTRLSNAGVTAQQVQVIWLKEANPVGATPVQTYYDSLVVQFKRIAYELKTRFPNVKLCYIASRISARYATSTLNPEPHAYWTGWAVKKVIEDQINGDPALQYSGTQAKAPWLAWGIYMWSDGSTPQKVNPTISLNCPGDFNTDGTHPSTAGAQKVGKWLLDFFSTETTATPWFLSVTTNGDQKAAKINKVRVSPNPFSDKTILTFDNSDFQQFTLTIFNTQGQLLLTIQNITTESSTIERQNLASGIYFYKLSGDGKMTTGKLVIK